MLHEEFRALLERHTPDRLTVTQIWNELEKAYTAPERHFHNLAHLEQMNEELAPLQPQINDWDTLLFALFFHDAVYDVVEYVTENNNEDRSAELAAKSLQAIGYPHDKTERCRQHILATKQHERSADNDTNFLTDADLSILGQPWEVYERYMKCIQREYNFLPDNIFSVGRSKVLNKFLQEARLFKTDHFFARYEAAARENMQRELEIISFY